MPVSKRFWASWVLLAVLVLVGSIVPARGAPAAVEVWHSGPGRVQPPPVGNVPPAPGATNSDPHQDPRNSPAAQDQISDFLEPNGAVFDVCGGQPCHASDYAP